MIPTNSSGTTNGCDNISSNCVIWQGPDISCLALCSGDTISEVTSKLATKVCDLITNGVSANPSLTGLNLKCLNIAGTTPTTLVPVLQAMVTQICLNNNSTSLLIDQGYKYLIIDLTETEYLDTVSVSMLKQKMIALDSIGGSIRLVVTEDKPRLTFSVNNNISQIRTYITVENALKDFNC